VNDPLVDKEYLHELNNRIYANQYEHHIYITHNKTTVYKHSYNKLPYQSNE